MPKDEFTLRPEHLEPPTRFYDCLVVCIRKMYDTAERYCLPTEGLTIKMSRRTFEAVMNCYRELLPKGMMPPIRETGRLPIDGWLCAYKLDEEAGDDIFVVFSEHLKEWPSGKIEGVVDALTPLDQA